MDRHKIRLICVMLFSGMSILINASSTTEDEVRMESPLFNRVALQNNAAFRSGMSYQELDQYLRDSLEFKADLPLYIEIGEDIIKPWENPHHRLTTEDIENIKAVSYPIEL